MTVHKRGDAFAFTGKYPDDVDLSGVVVRSQMRNAAKKLIVNLTVTLENNRLTFYCQDTNEWPLGMVYLDVEFLFPSGDIASTNTVGIKIIEDVTQK